MSPETASLKAALRRLVIATVVLYTVLALLFVFVFVVSAQQRTDLRDETNRTTAALCTLRADFEHRVAASKAFLKAHPDGISGITPQDIQRSIDGLETTIHALGALDCGGEP